MHCMGVRGGGRKRTLSNTTRAPRGPRVPGAASRQDGFRPPLTCAEETTRGKKMETTTETPTQSPINTGNPGADALPSLDQPITIREIMEAGVHFGHQTRRWNPKMKNFIFGARNGIHIIDLQQTVRAFTRAYKFLLNTVAAGRPVLFVGTKKQAQEVIRDEAARSS